MVTTCGMQAGYFSPNAIYSNTVVQILSDAGIEVSRPGLFISHAVLNLLIAVVVYVCFGGLKLIKRGSIASEQEAHLVTVGAGTTAASRGEQPTTDAPKGNGTGAPS